MSATAIAVPSRARLGVMFQDWITLSWRNLVAYMRIPEQAFFSTVQPIMFILLFRYVFGGAIPVPGVPYVDYLMPGVFAQTVAFGAIGTATGLADDLGKGLIERFRSLPMAQSAVLVGRTTADLFRNVFVVLLMAGVGYAVGFRIHTNVFMFLGAIGILLLLSYALAWGFATVGLLAPNSETAQLMAFPILLPLTFASSAFVRVQSMPGWLQAWANNQPVSVVIDAARQLMLGHDLAVQAARPLCLPGQVCPDFDPASVPSVAWISIKAIIWCIGILAVLAPFSVWRFRRTTIR
jgi:ABC-2 type transport system permease protein/oleandomycin transport system permease protein